MKYFKEVMIIFFAVLVAFDGLLYTQGGNSLINLIVEDIMQWVAQF